MGTGLTSPEGYAPWPGSQPRDLPEHTWARSKTSLSTWGPLTSAGPFVPGQGEASWAGAGEAAGHIAAGVGAGAGTARALVPVCGVGRGPVVCAHRPSSPQSLPGGGLPRPCWGGEACSPKQNSPWASSSKPSGQPTSFSSARQRGQTLRTQGPQCPRRPGMESPGPSGGPGRVWLGQWGVETGRGPHQLAGPWRAGSAGPWPRGRRPS